MENSLITPHRASDKVVLVFRQGQTIEDFEDSLFMLEQSEHVLCAASSRPRLPINHALKTVVSISSSSIEVLF